MIVLEIYREQTNAHEWPAWLKLIGLLVLVSGLFFVSHVWFLLLFFAMILFLASLPGFAFYHLAISPLVFLWPVFLMILIWNYFVAGFEHTLLVLLRMSISVVLAQLVTLTTKFSDMMAVLNTAMWPLRRLGVRTQLVQFSFGVTLRYISVLRYKVDTLSASWRARSSRRAGFGLILPLVISVLDDADCVSDAVRARGGLPKG